MQGHKEAMFSEFPLSSTFSLSVASPSFQHAYHSPTLIKVIFPVTLEPLFLFLAHRISFISFRLLWESSCTPCLPFLTCLALTHCTQFGFSPYHSTEASLPTYTSARWHVFCQIPWLLFCSYLFGPSAVIITLDFFFLQTLCMPLTWRNYSPLVMQLRPAFFDHLPALFLPCLFSVTLSSVLGSLLLLPYMVLK